MKTKMKLIVSGIMLIAGLCPLQLKAADASSVVKGYIEGDITGVIITKRGPNRSIEALVVVGSAPMPKGIRAAKGKEIAQKAAIRNARKNFSEFFNTQVAVSEEASGEVLIQDKGQASGDDAGTAATSTQSIDRSSEKYVSFSKSAQSALQMIGAGVYKDEFRVVFGWKASDCAAAKKVSSAMRDTAAGSVRDANTVRKATVNGETSREGGSGSASSVSDIPPGRVNTPKTRSSVSSNSNDFF